MYKNAKSTGALLSTFNVKLDNCGLHSHNAYLQSQKGLQHKAFFLHSGHLLYSISFCHIIFTASIHVSCLAPPYLASPSTMIHSSRVPALVHPSVSTVHVKPSKTRFLILTPLKQPLIYKVNVIASYPIF